jgi:hypothetical protein
MNYQLFKLGFINSIPKSMLYGGSLGAAAAIPAAYKYIKSPYKFPAMAAAGAASYGLGSSAYNKDNDVGVQKEDGMENASQVGMDISKLDQSANFQQDPFANMDDEQLMMLMNYLQRGNMGNAGMGGMGAINSNGY